MIDGKEFGWLGCALSAIGAGLSVTDLQAIISIIATVIGLLITITSSLIIPMIKKIKKANEDGKITADEMLEIAETAKDGLEEVKKEIEKK